MGGALKMLSFPPACHQQAGQCANTSIKPKKAKPKTYAIYILRFTFCIEFYLFFYMKYIKIKPGNSILQAAGQFHAFVLIFLQNAELLFYKCGLSILLFADFRLYKMRISHREK